MSCFIVRLALSMGYKLGKWTWLIAVWVWVVIWDTMPPQGSRREKSSTGNIWISVRCWHQRKNLGLCCLYIQYAGSQMVFWLTSHDTLCILVTLYFYSCVTYCYSLAIEVHPLMSKSLVFVIPRSCCITWHIVFCFFFLLLQLATYTGNNCVTQGNFRVSIC